MLKIAFPNICQAAKLFLAWLTYLTLSSWKTFMFLEGLNKVWKYRLAEKVALKQTSLKFKRPKISNTKIIKFSAKEATNMILRIFVLC